MRVVVGEAIRTVSSQKLVSAVTALLTAGMCIAVLMTSGKVAGNQQAVLSTIESAGTRAIVVRATAQAELTSEVLERLHGIEGIESAAALGAARDVRNAVLPDGAPVALRDFWGEGFGQLSSGEAIASPRALAVLGFEVAAGTVADADGAAVAIVGQIADPSLLHAYEPLLLTPRSADEVAPVSIIVVVAKDAAVVHAVEEVIRPMVIGDDPNQVAITTSERLAVLHGTVHEQLDTFGRALVTGSVLLAGLLVALVQSALVILKRKDWGRRRALGASRALILALMLTQNGITAILGAICGAAREPSV